MALSENPTLEEIVDEVERLNNLIVSRGGAQTITPSTSNKTLNKGYYKGNITIKGDANLVSSNIISGKSIFGVSGSATVSSLGGKKWASGTATTTKSTGGVITVTGLSFKPSYIMGFAYVNKNADNSITFQEPISTSFTYSSSLSKFHSTVYGASVSNTSASSSTGSGQSYDVGTSTSSKYYVINGGFKLKAWHTHASAYDFKVNWVAFE